MMNPVTNAPETTALANIREDGYVVKLSSAQNALCTFKADTADKKQTLFRAINNPDKAIKESYNITINLKDFYVADVERVKEDTGEVENMPRIILFDDKGTSYVGMSKGLFTSLKNLIDVFGLPDQWPKEGIKIMFKGQTVKKGTMSIFQLA